MCSSLHLTLSHHTYQSLSHSHSVLLRDFRSEDVDIAATNVLLIELLLRSLSLLIGLEHNQSVSSGLTVRSVKNDISFSNSEIMEEVTNFSHRSVERQAADLDSGEFVLFRHVV